MTSPFRLAALSGDKTLEVSNVSSPPSPPPGANSIGIARDFSFTDGTTTFSTNITLTFRYTDDQVAGKDESKLRVYWWDGSNWQSLGGTVDTDANTITVQTDHLSTFTVFESSDVAAPAAIADLSISRSGNSLVLNWSAITTDVNGGGETVSEYVVYRCTNPTFPTASTTTLTSTTQTDYTDNTAGIVGDESTNYFYMVKSIDQARNVSSSSNKVGEFDFEMLTNSDTYYYNFITLVLNSSISIGAQLGSILSPDGSKCYQIYKYNSSSESLDMIAKYSGGQWLDVGDAANYNVSTGHAYLVKMRKVSGNHTWTLIDQVPSDPQFTLQCSSTKNLYHLISLPLIHAATNNITTAAQLGASISSDGSTCYYIYRYNPTFGNLDIITKYSGGEWLNVGSPSNYNIRDGYPFFIKMKKLDSSITWP